MGAILHTNDPPTPTSTLPSCAELRQMHANYDYVGIWKVLPVLLEEMERLGKLRERALGRIGEIADAESDAGFSLPNWFRKFYLSIEED